MIQTMGPTASQPSMSMPSYDEYVSLLQIVFKLSIYFVTIVCVDVRTLFDVLRWKSSNRTQLSAID